MKKKQDILNAAERLFYSNGFHATSTDRICREASVSTRTLYRYFPSREQLTGAVMNARKDRFSAALLPAEDPAAIAQLFSVLGSWMQDYGTSGCFFLKAWGEYAEQDVWLSALALDYRYEMREYIAACVRNMPGQHREVLADAIWMLFEGAITAALVTGPEAAFRAGEAAALLTTRGTAR